MNNPTNQRVGLRRLIARTAVTGAAIVVALCGVGAAAASAETFTAAGPAVVQSAAVNTLVGTWQVYGTAGSDPVSPVFYFYADHTFKMLPGNGAYVAHGTWKQECDGAFTFHIEHYIYDSAGNPIYHIVGDQAGTETGNNAFSSTGISDEYDMSGNLVTTFTVTITGTRIAS